MESMLARPRPTSAVHLKMKIRIGCRLSFSPWFLGFYDAEKLTLLLLRRHVITPSVPGNVTFTTAHPVQPPVINAKWDGSQFVMPGHSILCKPMRNARVIDEMCELLLNPSEQLPSFGRLLIIKRHRCHCCASDKHKRDVPRNCMPHLADEVWESAADNVHSALVLDLSDIICRVNSGRIIVGFGRPHIHGGQKAVRIDKISIAFVGLVAMRCNLPIRLPQQYSADISQDKNKRQKPQDPCRHASSRAHAQGEKCLPTLSDGSLPNTLKV
mmetsp:Transcript_57711/g.160686  ORF Transcript_57711/g.160686 Transcript_57711/m.160686 type:complete len:270 (+) Transcript_57711:546-1355(+)